MFLQGLKWNQFPVSRCPIDSTMTPLISAPAGDPHRGVMGQGPRCRGDCVVAPFEPPVSGSRSREVSRAADGILVVTVVP